MDERTIPWWRKALQAVTGGVRSVIGLFARPPRPVPAQPAVHNEFEEKREEDKALTHHPAEQSVEIAAQDAADYNYGCDPGPVDEPPPTPAPSTVEAPVPHEVAGHDFSRAEDAPELAGALAPADTAFFNFDPEPVRSEPVHEPGTNPAPEPFSDDPGLEAAPADEQPLSATAPSSAEAQVPHEVSGHDFSRAEDAPELAGALTPVEKPAEEPTPQSPEPESALEPEEAAAAESIQASMMDYPPEPDAEPESTSHIAAPMAETAPAPAETESATEPEATHEPAAESILEAESMPSAPSQPEEFTAEIAATEDLLPEGGEGLNRPIDPADSNWALTQDESESSAPSEPLPNEPEQLPEEAAPVAIDSALDSDRSAPQAAAPAPAVSAAEPPSPPTTPQPAAEPVHRPMITKADDEAFPFSVFVGQVYDGPLDLLLDLIRKQDIDIYDIPIARITAQFLAYVNQLKASDVDNAGEFIYTASLLIHIKSKMLLPRAPAGPDDTPEDPRRELVERLLEHERFKNAAQMLQQKQMLEAATWTNPGLREFKDDVAAEPEIAADTVDLVRVFRDILERARNRPVLNVEEDSVTVGQMIQFLGRRLTMEDKPVALRRLLSHTRSERALIAMFLALLELVRVQAILLRQDRAFSDIFVKKHSGFDTVMNEGLTQARDDWR